uniref:(northern house mosquito) hypothetical protein n=1 Tax=Culex pipiens TaxID=7175 RepID=A0A8D8NZP0_CULPI
MVDGDNIGRKPHRIKAPDRFLCSGAGPLPDQVARGRNISTAHSARQQRPLGSIESNASGTTTDREVVSNLHPVEVTPRSRKANSRIDGAAPDCRFGIRVEKASWPLFAGRLAIINQLRF